MLINTENNTYYKEQLITYLGNKRRLLSFIYEGVCFVRDRLEKRKLDILDGFAGSGIVSRYLKQYSNVLYSNDFEYYAYLIGKCYLANKSEHPINLQEVVAHLNNIKLDPMPVGIVEDLYAPKDDMNIQEGERIFYTNNNAKIIDNIRRNISDIPEEQQHFYIAPLLSEASVKVNTSGVFKGFYRNSHTKKGQWGGNAKNCLTRIMSEIVLSPPVYSNFSCDCRVFNKDINELVKELPEVDLVYLDPPYNQHPYGSNYFMLNLISKYERPETISKVAGIPEDWQRSAYNKYKEAVMGMNNLISETKAKFILLSYNNEGIIPPKELYSILTAYGNVTFIYKEYNTYRASRNLSGRSNKVDEFLYILEK